MIPLFPRSVIHSRGRHFRGRSESLFSFQQNKELAACLADCGVAVVDAPEAIVSAVLEECPGAKTVTPGRIRTAIRRTKGFQETLKDMALEARKQV